MSPSEAVEADINKRVEKLERICQDIIGCRVTISIDGKHKQRGNLFKVTVDLSVPGNELVAVNHPLHEDVYVAVRDAFEASTRQLEEFAQRRRREVKNHSEQPLS
jgi:ribosomal subunit interface protein